MWFWKFSYILSNRMVQNQMQNNWRKKKKKTISTTTHNTSITPSTEKGHPLRVRERHTWQWQQRHNWHINYWGKKEGAFCSHGYDGHRCRAQTFWTSAPNHRRADFRPRVRKSVLWLVQQHLREQKEGDQCDRLEGTEPRPIEPVHAGAVAGGPMA